MRHLRYLTPLIAAAGAAAATLTSPAAVAQPGDSSTLHRYRWRTSPRRLHNRMRNARQRSDRYHTVRTNLCVSVG